MAEVKTVELKITTNIPDASKKVNELKESLKGVKTEAGTLNEEVGKTSKLGDVFGQLKQGAESLIPGLKGAQGAAAGLSTQFMALIANPIGLMIAGVVAGLKFLYEAFQSSIAGGKELKAIWAAIDGVGTQLKDAIFGLGRAFISLTSAAYKFITLDFKGAAESIKEANKEATTSYKQLGNAVDGTTAKIIYNLTKQQQAVDKARKQQAVVQSETNKLLVQSREILTDETASINEKKKALALVTKAETASSAERVRIAREDLRIAKERAKALGGEAEKKSKQELRDLTIALNEAETENAMTGIKLNKQRKMLNRQEAADAKAANDELKAIQKEKYDAEKLLIDELVKNENLSFEERRKNVNNDRLLTKADKDKYLKQINDEEAKKQAEHLKEVTDFENNLRKTNEDLSAKTEQEKLDLAKKRDEEEIARIAKTANEKANLQALLNEKYFNLQLDLDAKEKKVKDEKDQADLVAKEATNLTIANDTANTTAIRLAAIAEREAAEKNIIFKSQEEKTAYEKANSEARKKIAEEEKVAKMKLLQEISAGLSLAADELGQSTVAGKAAAVASATINTYAAIAGQLKAFSGVPIPGYAIAQAIVTGAAGLLQVKKILAVKVPSGGGGASASSPVSISGGASASTAAPQFNVVGTSGQNQIAQSLGNQAPVKAYVVSNDVTTAQSLDRNIVKTATVG